MIQLQMDVNSAQGLIVHFEIQKTERDLYIASDVIDLLSRLNNFETYCILAI